MKNESSDEQAPEERIQLGRDGVGRFRDSPGEDFEKIDGFGDGKENEKSPRAQNSQENHTRNI